MLAVDELVAGDVGPVSFTSRPARSSAWSGCAAPATTRVGRAIFGDVALTAGPCRCSAARRSTAPRRATRSAAVGFVSSKRGEESLAPSLTVRENLFINPVTPASRSSAPIRPAREQRALPRVLQRFSVRPPEPERAIATLSGGNQQKVIVARWMEAGSRLLVLEEPTFGVDVGSKAEIYQLLQEALDDGLAVLLISSDFEEVAGICHRALIFDRGRVTAELARDELSIARLTALASGAERQDQARLA